MALSSNPAAAAAIVAILESQSHETPKKRKLGQAMFQPALTEATMQRLACNRLVALSKWRTTKLRLLEDTQRGPPPTPTGSDSETENDYDPVTGPMGTLHICVPVDRYVALGRRSWLIEELSELAANDLLTDDDLARDTEVFWNAAWYCGGPAGVRDLGKGEGLVAAVIAADLVTGKPQVLRVRKAPAPLT